MKNSKKKSFLDNYDPQKIYDFKQVAKECGVSVQAVYKWIKKDGYIPKGINNDFIANYDTEGKLDIHFLADKYNVSIQSIYKWIRSINNPENNRIIELIKQINTLTKELNQLKKQ